MRPFPVLAGLALAALSAAGCASPVGDATARMDPAERWWSHVAELAGDRYEGRFTGSEGYARAAGYVADRFKANGLEPAGSDGYLQPVPLVAQEVAPAHSSLTLTSEGAARPLSFEQDVILGNRILQPKTLDAPLVFIGYGLHLPEAGYDDVAAAGDLKGKIVVYLNGGPSTLSAALKSHSRAADFEAMLERAGAVGSIGLSNPKSMDIPWERSVLLSSKPGMWLDDPALARTQGEFFTASFNPAQAEALFAGSGHSFAEMLALADAQKPLPRFALKGRLSGSVAAMTRKLASPNIVGLLRGSDPALKDEYVVLTAHLDGLGVGEPIAGDRIYNGAMDNAAGIASMLEAARALQASKQKPKRSILFVAVTAEERGLLGSRWFAERPTVARSELAANINMDMYLPLFPLKALTVLGAEESTLGAQARAAAEARGLALVPDPQPDRNSFIRSDQYSFIRTGVPALALKFATPMGSQEAALQKAWLTAALPRALRRPRPAGRPGRRGAVQPLPRRPDPPRRRRAPTPALEGRQLLQALRGERGAVAAASVSVVCLLVGVVGLSASRCRVAADCRCFQLEVSPESGGSGRRPGPLASSKSIYVDLRGPSRAPWPPSRPRGSPPAGAARARPRWSTDPARPPTAAGRAPRSGGRGTASTSGPGSMVSMVKLSGQSPSAGRHRPAMQNQSWSFEVNFQRVFGYLVPVNSKKCEAGIRQRPRPNRRPSERKLITGAALGRNGLKPHFSVASSTPSSRGRTIGAGSVGRISSRGSRLGAACGSGKRSGSRIWLNSSTSWRKLTLLP